MMEIYFHDNNSHSHFLAEKFQFQWIEVKKNFQWTFYFCLILAEGRANCSFQGLIIAKSTCWLQRIWNTSNAK